MQNLTTVNDLFSRRIERIEENATTVTAENASWCMMNTVAKEHAELKHYKRIKSILDNSENPKKSLEELRKIFLNTILNNGLNGGSSNTFSNGLEEIEREILCSVIRELEGILDFL